MRSLRLLVRAGVVSCSSVAGAAASRGRGGMPVGVSNKRAGEAALKMRLRQRSFVADPRLVCFVSAKCFLLVHGAFCGAVCRVLLLSTAGTLASHRMVWVHAVVSFARCARGTGVGVRGGLAGTFSLLCMVLLVADGAVGQDWTVHGSGREQATSGLKTPSK